MIRGSIKLIETQNKIQNSIFGAIEKEIKLRLNGSIYKIRADIINITIEALEQSPEIQSLRDGKLRLDFGLNFDPTTELIYAIANSIYVQFKGFRFFKKSSNNVLTVYIQPQDFRNILSLSSANVITEKGTSIPWLQWLLTAGDGIVISGYKVAYGSFTASRSGGAIMIPVSVFKVDSQFSGTINDNFITRALDSKIDEIAEVLEKYI